MYYLKNMPISAANKIQSMIPSYFRVIQILFRLSNKKKKEKESIQNKQALRENRTLEGQRYGLQRSASE